MIRQTHTVATLEVSGIAYDEIAQLLREADYRHVFLEDGTIDMTGIGLTRKALDVNQAIDQRGTLGQELRDVQAPLREQQRAERQTGDAS